MCGNSKLLVLSVTPAYLEYCLMGNWVPKGDAFFSYIVKIRQFSMILLCSLILYSSISFKEIESLFSAPLRLPCCFAQIILFLNIGQW